MMISVIVPVYNMGLYIDKCVKSVLTQSYQDFELILINDGSTDDSLEKCIAWSKCDERIIVVNKKNEGLGPTRNIGVRMSKTKYVTFLDADDWWDSRYLELMVRGTDNGKNDLVICDINYVTIDDNGEVNSQTSAIRLSYGAIDNKVDIINKARTFMCGKVYKKSLFIQHNIEQPAHAYEDVATTPFLVAQAKNIYHVDAPLYFYWRNRQGSIVNQNISLNDMVKSLFELHNRFLEVGIFSKYKQALKRLFIGQIRFVSMQLQTKFKNIDDDKKVNIQMDLIKLLNDIFPEMGCYSERKFYVLENEVVLQAVKNIVLNRSQIVEKCDLGEIKSVDYVIGDKVFLQECQQNIFSNAKYIEVDISNLRNDDSFCWDLTDQIFNRL